jgi:hypothetical protein
LEVPEVPGKEIEMNLKMIAFAMLIAMAAGSWARADSLPDSPTAQTSSGLSMLHANGGLIVDEAGRQVILKGCNLGNYLMLESWMLGGCIQQHGIPFRDPATFLRTLRSRFGPDRANDLIDAYRQNYIEARDFALIKSFKFNLVRLPFDYRLLQEDQPPFQLKGDAFRWLDHALDMAEAAGVYVILDLHGAPGGQSLEDHTGEAGQNHLWKNGQNYQRTIALWRAIAERYKNRSVVAAYDLLNEPYSDHKMDVRAELARLMPLVCQAIRGTGDQHLMFFPGALGGGISFYGGVPKGTANIGFTEHYYPGMFGDTPSMETQARTLNLGMPITRSYLTALAVPYYVGEFNVVLEAEDPARTMRAYYDLFAEYGWAGTMWSYRLLKPRAGAAPNAWYMATNAEPLPELDLDTSSFDDFQAFFSGIGQMPLAVNRPLREALTANQSTPLNLRRFASAPASIPPAAQSAPPGFASGDLGDAKPGYTAVQADQSLLVFAGGSDVNGLSDSCRFVSEAAHEPIDIRATITSMVESDRWAKAGVMARWGTGADAAMAMVNVFPDGTVALMTRARRGAGASEIKSVAEDNSLPVELRLQVNSGEAIGSCRGPGGEWTRVGTAEVAGSGDCQAGLFACSHNDVVYTRVRAFLGKAADLAIESAKKSESEPVSLLVNGSFESPGDQPDEAAGWNRWGDRMNRETGWTPVHGGSSLIGYHHWQIERGEQSGLWQDVHVQGGRRYIFSIFAQHDPAKTGENDAKNLELRVESSLPGGQVTLNSRTFDIAKLPTGQRWAHLSVPATAASDTMRVLAILNSSDEGPRGGAVKLDDASVSLAPD